MQSSFFSTSISQHTTAITGLRGSAFTAFATLATGKGPLCIIVADEHQIAGIAEDLSLFTDRQILHYPGYEIPPYTPLSPDPATTASRLSSLYRMQSEKEAITICSITALQRRILPPAILNDTAEYLEADESFDREKLLEKLATLGYEKTALVQSIGDFALRGGIIDIYPPPFTNGRGELCEGPIRLDFFGDTIEAIRLFDPISQRSTGQTEDATLLPVTEILLDAKRTAQRRLSRLFAEEGEKRGWQSTETARLMERCDQGLRFAGMEFFLPLYYTDPPGTVFDILPSDSTLLLLDPGAIRESLSLAWERIETNFATARADHSPALPPEALFFSPAEMDAKLARYQSLNITDFPEKTEEQRHITSNNHLLLKQEISLKRAKFGLLAPLSDQIFLWQRQQGRVILCCRSSRHLDNLSDLLLRHNHQIEQLSTPLDLKQAVKTLQTDTLYLCAHPLTQGFSLPEEQLHLLSESELFGEMRVGNRSRKRAKGEPVRFTELNTGDIVVHRDHGLALYCGLNTLELQGVTNDFVLLEYRDGDRLYLPVDRLNLISRYQGLSDNTPRLDKLGSQAWKTTTAKVKEEVWKVAQELLDIYARRELKQGRQFSPPGTLYHELEESFPYEETSGQAAAINDTLADLLGERPMDRLVCGDVGYGKTEVAIRAAFKVVEDGFQVAILVPTTVLAEQHTKTFRQRLDGFPVTIDCLNRFRSVAEQKQILHQLERGKIDIIIGTHRLLSKDVVMKKLGLVVIDEEHRFGVAHKEKLKKMRAEVDILTLTATPIPRTLQMSLLSIRDLSVISTPPEHRQPVKTFVARFDELVIKEAVSHELRRGGQVFFVHNRVKSIHSTAKMIQELAPEAKIAVAHGQMNGKELEEIMVAFVNGTIDVLVATTIIESGLDIPAANTIIINRADTLGLAEIYQLRGRVGRSSAQAFAYLLVPSLDHLSKDSKDRLRALMDTNELGGGFKLAMSDLQIRGGGNLLGVSQSGNIAAIGYDLYLDLLQKTVADLKARQNDTGQLTTELDPEVKLQLSAYIPEQYIPDISQRYICYRRIAALTSESKETRDDLTSELTDRYGNIPEELTNLLRIIDIKKELAALRIEKLEQGPDSLIFHFLDDTPLGPEILLEFLHNHPQTKKRKAARLTPDGRLIHFAPLGSVEQIFSTLTETLAELKKMEKTRS